MNQFEKSDRSPAMYFLQIISVSFIWILVISLTFIIFNLIFLSLELNDAPGASIGISIIAIPVFFTLAGILTYVFIGLRKEETRLFNKSTEEEATKHTSV